MKDPRLVTLAKNLVTYSCDVKKNDKVLIENIGLETPLITELIKQVYEAGGTPFVTIKDREIDRAILLNCTIEHMETMAKYEVARMSEMQAYIGVRAGNNASELSDVPSKNMQIYNKYFWHAVHGNIRVPHTKWVVLRYPNYAMAQLANTSLEAFEDFYFKVCNLDYAKMSSAMDSLSSYLSKTDKVQIKGPGTDITFSIKGLPPRKCSGERNIPDGELYTAPVKDSVNGIITYNTPSVYQGTTFENISLEFKNGKIEKATANYTDKINDIFNTDEGARYVGEFSFGLNPYITKPMKDTLFDEKIAGSIHFTPGSSYDECFNGNKSAVHWDLVLIQTPEWGGGEIYLDDILIRKDGRFVVKELEKLNPENLM